VYEPGSVNKLVTISAALQSGAVTPDERFIVPDSKMVDGSQFRDAEPHPVENWTTTDILANSSNIGTINIAERLGKDRLNQFLRAYGFGQMTSLNYPGESAGLLLDPRKWSGTSIATVPIGQGVAVTAVQMLAAYNTIANGGTYVAPKLIAGTMDGKGKQHPTPPSARHQVVSPDVARAMTTMLGEVVRIGTGTTAAIDGYTVAGKTGTARIPLVGARGYQEGVYASSFAGFVPAERPSLTGIVIIDGTAQFGATTAAPVFAQIARYGLREFRIPPQPPQPPPPGVPLATPASAAAAGEPGAAAPPTTGSSGGTAAKHTATTVGKPVGTGSSGTHPTTTVAPATPGNATGKKTTSTTATPLRR
jgi:cell division protein FtsI (penicillin-binding protein 3)